MTNNSPISNQHVVKIKQPLFWLIAWTAWRLHENSKITGNKLPHNIFVFTSSILIILMAIDYLMKTLEKHSPAVQNQSQTSATSTTQDEEEAPADNKITKKGLT